MNDCFFVSDLHGQLPRYKALFSKIKQEKPEAVFLGGDLFPSFSSRGESDFLTSYLAKEFIALKNRLGSNNIFGYAYVPSTPFLNKNWGQVSITLKINKTNT